MSAMRVLLGVLSMLAILASARATQYFPESCSATCANGNFIPPLPEETGPVDQGDNRAYAWAIVSLIQTKLNFASLSPPGSARISAIVGSCLYEASVLSSSGKPHRRHTRTPYSDYGYHKRHNDEVVTNTMDGAGFFAVYAIFGQRPSFSRVFQQYKAFSGEDIRPLLPLITNAHISPWKNLFGKGGIGNLGRIQAIVAGAAACRRIVERYTADGFEPDGTLGGQPDPTGYAPLNIPQTLAGITDCDSEIIDINRWQPLCVPNDPDGFGTTDCNAQQFLAPFAGRYTPFALEDGDETTGGTLVEPPPPAGSAQFEEEWREVLQFSGELDDPQKIIAEYWADGPDSTFPPGHFWKIAADAALDENLDQSETARLLFIVGNAVYDAGIASWRSKTTFDFVRPLQMIQCGAYRGQERTMWLGPYQGVGLGEINTWRPYQAAKFVTPPFAAYTSGHSTFSEAAAEAMRLFFKSDKYRGPPCHLVREGESLFEPRSNEIPGVSDIPNTGPSSIGYVPRDDQVLCWDTWTDASNQAGISRLFGGIHIRADDVGGKFMGNNAGAGVFQKATRIAKPSDF